MSKYRICLVLLFIPLFTFSQKCVDKFIDKHLYEKQAYALSLPGWFIKTTAKAVKKFETDEEAEKYWKLTDYVKNFRVFLIDNYNPFPANEIRDLRHKILNEEHFDEYIAVRDKETRLSMFAREKGEKIDAITFLINAEDAFLILHLKLQLPLNYFKKLNYHLINSGQSEQIDKAG